MRNYKFHFIKLLFSNLNEGFKDIIKNCRNNITIRILLYIIYFSLIILLI